MKVAVVGAGIVGSCAALRLVDQGHDVTVYEPVGPANKRGSSHGASRIVRRAYPDAFFTQIMQEAYPLWGELEARCGMNLLHEVGLLYYGLQDSDEIRSMIVGLGELGVEHEVLDSARCREKMRRLQLPPEGVGVWTPEAGWVEAERAVQVAFDAAVAAGARWRQEWAPALDDLEREFDGVCLAAGAWMSRYVALDTVVTVQTFGYASPGVRQTADLGGPVWIQDGGTYPYGFPAEPGRSSVKIGIHALGPEINPDATERPASEDAMEEIRQLARERYGWDNCVVDSVTTCLYTSTPDIEFRIGRSGKTAFVSACSGHGFKFGPWSGKLLADLATGARSATDFPRFDRSELLGK